MLIIPIILIIEDYLDSTLDFIGIVKKKSLSGICSEDLVNVCLFSPWSPQNLILIVLLLLLFLV